MTKYRLHDKWDLPYLVRQNIVCDECLKSKSMARRIYRADDSSYLYMN